MFLIVYYYILLYINHNFLLLYHFVFVIKIIKIFIDKILFYI
jgi:hypothetical protein